MKFFNFTLTSLFILAFCNSYAQSCGNDTVLYAKAKATADAPYTLSAASNFLAYGQYYDAPIDIKVKGLCFYGHVPSGQPVTVTGLLYDTDPQDSLPFDPPMAIGSVTISNSDANAPLAQQRHCLNFDQEITMYNAYVVAIETDGNTPIKIYGNGWTDGQGEQLAIAKYSYPWVKMINFASDNDFYIEPIVEYSLLPSMSFAGDTACVGSNFHFSGAAPDVSFNRMYCKSAFGGNIESAFSFEVDGNILNETLDTFYAATTTGPVVVSFTESITGWTNSCSKTISDTIFIIDEPIAYFSTFGQGQTVDFTSNSENAGLCFWDFGDGATAATYSNTIQHSYDIEGVYNVCLTVSNPCGSNTACIPMQVPFTGVGVNETTAQQPVFSMYPNPAKGELFINTNAFSGQTTVQIFDLSGRLISGETVATLPARIDVSSLTPGLYIVRLNNAVAKKLVIAE